MCIGIPMKSFPVRVPWPSAVTMKKVGMSGRPVSDWYAKAGNWVLVFMGAAREVIDPDQLEVVLQARKAMAAALKGEDVDAFFADLVGREPELPDF